MHGARGFTVGLKVSAMGAALSCALVLGGCGGQAADQSNDSSAQDEPAAEQQQEQAAAPSVPGVFFNSLYAVDGGWATADGSVVESVDVGGGRAVPLRNYSDDEGGLIGPFSEGFALVAWRTSDNDKEWNTETNIRMHVAVVSKDGTVVKNLDDALSKYVDTNGTMLMYDKRVSFSDGIALLNVVSEEGNDLVDHLLAIDTQGNVRFTIDGNNKDYTNDSLAQQSTFYDGVAKVSDDVLVDTKGTVLFDARKTSLTNAASAGKGLAAEENGYDDVIGDVLYGYDGKAVFNVDSLKGDKYSEASGQVLGEGLVLVRLREESPHGDNTTHMWTGVYDANAKKWVIGPARKALLAGPVRDGVFALLLSDVESSGGMGQQASSSSDDGDLPNGIGLMRTDGSWAVEPSEQAVSMSSTGKDAAVSYLGGGLWQLSSDADYSHTVVSVSGSDVEKFDPAFEVEVPIAYWDEER